MERLKILVVDDESRMRKLVKDFLVRQRKSTSVSGTKRQLTRIQSWCT